MAAQPPVCDFGWPAQDFELADAGGRRYRLSDLAGPNGTLVMFICNHCPYVKAVVDRIVRDCVELAAHGVAAVAVMSNDVAAYPDDAPDRMKSFALEHGFTFPYLYDGTQAVARAYGAVCTPDFFGFNRDLELQYRGRLDGSRKEAAAPDVRRELFEAMLKVARDGKGPPDQSPSMGCSIKWKESA